MKLTETTLSKLTSIPDKHLLISDDLTPSLYLKHYANSGRKSFIYRARRNGQWEVVTLGKWPDMSLAAARKKATELNERRTGTGAGKTFGELLDLWFEARIEPRYKRTANIETYITKGKDTLGNKQLSVLTTRETVAALQHYAKVSPVAANRCLSNWKLALDFAVECGYIEHNPLARTTARVVGGEEKSRSRVLTDEEIRKVWGWNDGNAPLLRFLLLTGLRISEAQQGVADGDLFRVAETKNGKAHWVPLTQPAKDNLQPFKTSPTAVQAWLKRKIEREGVEPFTPHDLRRTFATRLAGMGIEPHVVEKCLNHSMQGVLAIYNRHDYSEQRIAAAEQWANELTRIIESS